MNPRTLFIVRSLSKELCFILRRLFQSQHLTIGRSIVLMETLRDRIFDWKGAIARNESG